MKKSISIILCICLVLSSFSFCFADFGTTDSTNLSNIKNLLSSGGAIYNFLNTISGRLYSSNNSIAYWVKGIYDNTFLNGEGTLAQICNGAKNYLNSISSKMDSSNGYFGQILAKMPQYDISGLLAHPKDINGVTTMIPYLKEIYDLQNYDGNLQYFKNLGTIPKLNYNGNGNTNQPTFPLTSASISGHIFNFITGINESLVNHAVDTWNNFQHLVTGYNTQQVALSWTDLNSQYTFSPTSTTDGIYKWFATLHAPVARLSYVLASDQRIETQELSEPNEQAVVDNFIDSSGNGSVSVSDFENIASFSDGYKNTFTSDASPTAIFSIFNSDHMGWFSQDTKNQLDTTNNNNRNSKTSEYSTPLLDIQIKDIYNSLGVKMP